MKKRKIFALILILFLFTWGCGSESVSNEPKQEQTQKEENAAVETTLGAGEWYVGEDIPAGRYVITTSKDGRVAIYNPGKTYYDISEILDPEGIYGVESLTYDLKDGQKIRIEEVDDVLFTPKEQGE